MCLKEVRVCVCVLVGAWVLKGYCHFCQVCMVNLSGTDILGSEV